MASLLHVIVLIGLFHSSGSVFNLVRSLSRDTSQDGKIATEPECKRLGANPSNLPLAVCQGDCDKDEDCAGNSVCIQRSNGGSVPGCGVGDSYDSSFKGTDYCNNPALALQSATKPALKWLGGSPSNLGVCQGDCDKDEDCPQDSVCIQRSHGGSVPGCAEGDSNHPGREDSDYCNNPYHWSPGDAPSGINTDGDTTTMYLEGLPDATIEEESMVASIAANAGGTYAATVKILQNSQDQNNAEYVQYIKVNDKSVGDCVLGRAALNCTWQHCKTEEGVRANEGMVHLEITFFLGGNPSSCDCDESTWECSPRGTVAGRQPIKAAAQLILAPSPSPSP